ncbi:hypothetical protein [Streptomyces sp. 7N604]|uniref:hypothetical protein n=1 Tax=Streptomyces sp. 7N604 TaxID=3457415 RepID=UPI003FD5C3DE
MAGSQKEPDRLVAVVERVIEEHLPGGPSGVDVRSMAKAIVRRVRIEQLVRNTAALSEKLEDLTRATEPLHRDGGGPGDGG